VPEKIIDTLTSSILKSEHNAIYFITFCKLYSVATPEHPKCLQLEKFRLYHRPMTDLQRVSFYRVPDFLYYSCTNELISSLKLIELFWRFF
jgi:hypothetical protein